MSVGNYYALSALPTLEGPGTVPPLDLFELPDRVPPGRPRSLVSAVLLSDDLLQREAWLAGELRLPRPAVLALAELRGDAPMREELAVPPAGEDPERLPADALWEVYVRYVAGLASATRSALLRAWIATEVGLRNQLARRRARALRMDPDRYVVAEDLGEIGPDERSTLQAWVEAPDPLHGLRALLMARWRWVAARDPLYSFRDDEFVAYAVKLMVLHRWQRAGAGTRPGRR
jgi:hypothetical protein